MARAGGWLRRAWGRRETRSPTVRSWQSAPPGRLHSLRAPREIPDSKGGADGGEAEFREQVVQGFTAPPPL